MFLSAATATSLAVKQGKAEEIEDAGNRVARHDLAYFARCLEEQGLRVVASHRYAMVYKHRPGWVMRALRLPGLRQLAWFAWRAVDRVIGSWGNKLTIQAGPKAGNGTCSAEVTMENFRISREKPSQYYLAKECAILDNEQAPEWINHRASGKVGMLRKIAAVIAVCVVSLPMLGSGALAASTAN